MGLFSKISKKQQPLLDRYQSMEGIPVLNSGISMETGEDGTLVLRVTVERGSGFLDRFRPPEMTRRIKLDELGSFVVRLIDGRRNVLDIVEAFEAKYKTNRRETQLSIVAFLKSLVTRHVASIAIE